MKDSRSLSLCVCTHAKPDLEQNVPFIIFRKHLILPGKSEKKDERKKEGGDEKKNTINKQACLIEVGKTPAPTSTKTSADRREINLLS